MGWRFGIAVLLTGSLCAVRGAADDLDQALEQARQTLDYVQRSAPQPVLARELEILFHQRPFMRLLCSYKGDIRGRGTSTLKIGQVNPGDTIAIIAI